MGIIIGVDGGGTKTGIIAADVFGNTLAYAKGNSINYNNISMDEAVSNFYAAINSLKLGYDADIVAISIGNPAMDDISVDKNTEIFKERISELYNRSRIFMKSDAFMALYGLTKGDPGVFMISGTGSMGIAIDEKEEIYIAGGWGRPTSDGGSAYDIAVKGLTAAFNFYDGVGEETMLAEAATKYYGTETLRDVIPVLNDSGYKKSHIAMFATVVSRCGELGDIVALDILTQAAKRLSDYVIALIKKIGKEDCLVGIYGGVFQNNEYIREKFSTGIKEKYPEVQIKIPDMKPEEAAVIYALRS